MQTTVELGQTRFGSGKELRPAASATERAGSTAQLAELRQRVTRTAHPCGCKSGAVMVIAALVLWPAWTIWSGLPKSVAGVVGALAAWTGVILASAVAGKLGGI